MLLLLLVLSHAFSLEQMIIDEDPQPVRSHLTGTSWKSFVLLNWVHIQFSVNAHKFKLEIKICSEFALCAVFIVPVCNMKNCLRLSLFYWLILLGSCGFYNMLKIFMYITFMHLTNSSKNVLYVCLFGCLNIITILSCK